MSPPRRLRSGAPVVVFTAGCFNRLHEAHLRLLQRARALGDRLVVVLAHDAHNHKSTAVPAARRKQRIEALNLADRVLIGDPDGFADTLRRENPAILVLGYDQSLPDEATARAAADMKVEIIRMPWFPGKDKLLPTE